MRAQNELEQTGNKLREFLVVAGCNPSPNKPFSGFHAKSRKSRLEEEGITGQVTVQSGTVYMLSIAARSPRTSWPRLARIYRLYSTRRSKFEPTDKWNYNTSPLYDTTVTDFSKLKWVTANDLEGEKSPPREVRMLARDFIEDSLYNPNYGYFSKQAAIFDTRDAPFDFPRLRDTVEFQWKVTQKYAEYGHNLQLWHTPTELFKVCPVTPVPTTVSLKCISPGMEEPSRDALYPNIYSNIFHTRISLSMRSALVTGH